MLQPITDSFIIYYIMLLM